MSTKSFSFYWHGHRRGSLKFTVLYNLEENDTKYDCISTSQLTYLDSISKKHVPNYKNVSLIEESGPPYTLRQVICAIFKNDDAIVDSYERYCRFHQNEDENKSQNGLIEFAFNEFEYIHD
jgi:hypothetical protein